MRTFLLIRTDGFEWEGEITPGIRITGHTPIDISSVDWWDNAHKGMWLLVDKEAHADVLLKYLAEKAPGQTWKKYRLCGTAKAKPGPVEVTTVTEQGVLPA